MSSENKALIWGLEHEKGNPIPQAVKFIIEEESPLFSAPQCPIFESQHSLHASADLKRVFKDNKHTLPPDTVIALSFGSDNEYVIVEKDTEAPVQKPDYLMRVEDDKIHVFSTDQHTVSISDIVAILTINKCCQDYIRTTTQNEKGMRKQSLDDMLSTLSPHVSHLHSQLQAAKEEGRRYEEVVLDICTDEFLLTCEQSQKVLALLLASIQKLVEEEKDYEIADSVPYCQ